MGNVEVFPAVVVIAREGQPVLSHGEQRLGSCARRRHGRGGRDGNAGGVGAVSQLESDSERPVSDDGESIGPRAS